MPLTFAGLAVAFCPALLFIGLCFAYRANTQIPELSSRFFEVALLCRDVLWKLSSEPLGRGDRFCPGTVQETVAGSDGTGVGL